MTEVNLADVDFESIEDVLQGIEDEIISRTSAGFGLTSSEKKRVYEEIRTNFRTYADIFLRNIDPDTAQYICGSVRKDSERHNCHYVIGEYKEDTQIGLFLCYKDGRDSVGPVKNLELGGFDGQFNEEMKEELCSRSLFDNQFNHILSTPGEPTLRICRADLPSTRVVEVIYKELVERNKQSFFQRLVAYIK